MTGKKKERDRGAETGQICSDNIKMQREEESERKKKNESEKEIGSNEERERAMLQTERDMY